MPATAAMILEQVRAALGTEEEGSALVEVALNAHKAEQELGHFKRRVRDSGWTLKRAYAKLTD